MAVIYTAENKNNIHVIIDAFPPLLMNLRFIFGTMFIMQIYWKTDELPEIFPCDFHGLPIGS